MEKKKHTRTPIIHPNFTMSVCDDRSLDVITELLILLSKSIVDVNLNFDGIFAVPCNTSSVGRLFGSYDANENIFL